MEGEKKWVSLGKIKGEEAGLWKNIINEVWNMLILTWGEDIKVSKE